ncbi:MAG: hypothetical protein PF444_05385, partial [Bacteroidales bacterium]|nr:hypothetical protein [Bacteroidales bacterium]
EGLLQENLTLKASMRLKNFDARHADFVNELHTHNKTISLRDSQMWSDIESNMHEIASQKSIYLSDDIHGKMKALFDQLYKNETLATAWAHGDFVPWNTFASDDKLFVYDWELAQDYYPALFDVFHFVFQSRILIEQQSFDEIIATLNEVVEMPEIKPLVQEHRLDVKTQLAYYLLLNVSSYLNIYMVQKQLHRQVYWLLNVWNQALDYVLTTAVKSKSDRDVYIAAMLPLLHDQKLEYAVLKIADKNIFQLDESSDIDLLFERSAVDRFIQDQMKFPYLDRIHVSKKSNLTTLELFFRDQSFLSIDLVTAFKRRSTVYLDASKVLSRKFFDERGFYRLSYEDDLDYMLYFYLLNGDVVPKHYQAYFLKLPTSIQSDVLFALNKALHTDFINLEKVFENQKNIKPKLQYMTKKSTFNMGKNKIKNWFLYLSDTLKSMKNNRAYIITLSGVDGAGKTTVLEATKAYVENTLRRKVVLLRHRPSILPILSAYVYGKDAAEQQSASKLPRTGTNTSVFKSLLRFMYYYLDYSVGQWMVLCKYQLRGKVVIYDRYYFDFINDPRRTNIELPRWFIKFGYRFLLKPRLNFFLYAEPEIILARKQELDADTIRVLTEKYMSTFVEFEKRYKKSHYVCIESLQLEDTLKTITQHINTLA